MPKRQVSARIDVDLLREVRVLLKTSSDSETLQRSLERSRDDEVELRQMRRLLRKWGGKGGPDAFAGAHPRRP